MAVPALASFVLDDLSDQQQPLFRHWHSVWHLLALVSTAYAMAFVLAVHLVQVGGVGLGVWGGLCDTCAEWGAPQRRREFCVSAAAAVLVGLERGEWMWRMQSMHSSLLATGLWYGQETVRAEEGGRNRDRLRM